MAISEITAFPITSKSGRDAVSTAHEHGLAPASARISASDFGAVGDGTTDNSTALIAMRDFINQDKTTHYDIFFPPGHYVYTNNRWLLGVGSVTLWAYGVKFQNVTTNTWTENFFPFGMQRLFREDGDVPTTDPFLYNIGHIINDAALGSTTVTLSTLGEVSNFSVGDRILIHGFDQQGSSSFSWPPNMLYFQWNTISAIDVGTGVVSLHRPLHHVFRSSDWLDTQYQTSGHYYGKARIISLERTNFYYPRYISIRGAEILAHPTSLSIPTCLDLVAEEVELRDVTCPGLIPNMNRVWRAYNTTFGFIEPDKICDKVVLSGCTMDPRLADPTPDPPLFLSATGVNDLIVEDCYLVCAVQVSPRRLYMRRNTIVLPAGTTIGAIRSQGAFTSELFLLEDNTIVHDGALPYLIRLGPGFIRSLTVGSVGANNEIKITGSQANLAAAISNITIGSLMYAADYSNAGRVTNIAHDGTDFVIAGTWGPTPSGVWKFPTIKQVRERGTIWRGGVRRMFDAAESTVSHLVTDDGVGPRSAVINITEEICDFSAIQMIWWLVGRIRRIKVRVTKPYTGVATPVLLIRLNDGTTNTQYISMSLLQVGYAETTVSGTYGLPTPSQLTQLPANTVWEHTQIVWDQLPTNATQEELPRFSIEIEAESIA